MDFRSSVADGRRAVDLPARRWFQRGLFLFSLLLAAVSAPVAAQTCDFVQIGSPSQLAPAGSTVGFTLEAQTACAATVNVALAVATDTTGGAAIVGPTTITATLDTPFPFSVTLGPIPGGSGTVTATCLGGGCAGQVLTYTFATNNQFSYTAATPATVTTNQISGFTVATNLQLNGAPGGLQTSFTNLTTATPLGTVVPDAGGVASLNTSIFTAGTYTVRGAVVCPVLFVLEGCPPPPVDFTVVVEPVAVTAVTPLTPVTPVGTPLAMAVAYGSASLPAPDGTNMNWSVTAQPPGGDGAVIGNTIAGGQSTASFSATVPGLYTVVANSGCTFCSPGLVSFTVDVQAPPITLTPLVANPVVATAGIPFGVSVRLEQGGLPLAGQAIAWAANPTAGFTPFTAASVTDGNGDASATFSNPNPGTYTGAVVATYDPDGVPASGDETVFAFDVTITALGTLTVVSGDAQTLAVGAASQPLVVELLDAAGLPVPGATIAWATTGGSLGSATSVTNGAGQATNTVTLAVPGDVQVTASSPLAATTATFSFSSTLASLPGLNRRLRGVAVAIDTLCPALANLPTPTPQQLDLLARCQEITSSAGIDPARTIEALDALFPDVAMTQANAAMSVAQAQFHAVKTRIAALRSGTRGADFGGLALRTSGGDLSLGALLKAVAGEPEAEIGADFSRWGFFVSGTLGGGDASGGVVDPAYDYDLDGITAGVDYRKSDRWIFGSSLGYTRQDTSLPVDGGGLDARGFTVSAYTTYYQPDSWYVDGVLTWGRNDFDLRRNITYTVPLPGGGTSTVDQVARASADGGQLSAAFTFGRDFDRGAWSVGPYGRVLYTRLDFDRIVEQTDPGLPGSGLGMVIEDRELTSLATVFGAKATYTASMAWGVLMPHLQLEWEHEFEDDPQSIEARFLQDPTGTPIIVEGDPLDTDYFRLGIGLSMVLSRGRSGFFYYERLFGKSGFSQYHLALGYRGEF